MGKGPLTTDATDATNTMDAVAPEVLAGRVHPRLMTQLRSLEGISAAESTKSASSTTATKDNAKQEEYALVYILGEKQPLRIPKAAAYKICSTNEKGEALKALEAGRSQVAKVGNVFYKVGDNDIPTEIAVYTFMQILTSQLKLSEHAKKATPDVALIFVKLDGKTIPVQVTEAIDGYSLEDVVRLVPMINHMSQCFTPDLGDGSTTEDEQESNISDPECDISDDSINSSDNGDIKTIDKKILEQIHELYTTHNSKAVTAVTEEEQKKTKN